VQLTANGKSAVDRALEELLVRENKMLASISIADRTKLATILRSIVLPFDKESAGLEN
jgi:hypothetical protein